MTIYLAFACSQPDRSQCDTTYELERPFNAHRNISPLKLALDPITLSRAFRRRTSAVRIMLLCCVVRLQKANIWQQNATVSSSKCRRYSITRWTSCSSARCARYDYVRLRRRPAAAQRRLVSSRRRTTSIPISNTSISSCRRRPTTRPLARRRHCSVSVVCSGPPWSYSANYSSDRLSGRRHATTCSSRDVIEILHLCSFDVRQTDNFDRLCIDIVRARVETRIPVKWCHRSSFRRTRSAQLNC
jgi:hypothetical protein